MMEKEDVTDKSRAVDEIKEAAWKLQGVASLLIQGRGELELQGEEVSGVSLILSGIADDILANVDKL